MDFWRAVGILSRHKWLILLSVVVTTALTFAATRLVGSRYLATVHLVTPATSPLTSSPALMSSDERASEPVQTKQQAAVFAAMLKSRDVLEPALGKLSLSNTEIATQIPALVKGIEFETTGNRLYELRVTDGSPARAQLLANALADSMVEKARTIYTERASGVVRLLEEQLQDTDKRLADTRSGFERYRAKHGVITNLSEQLSPALYRLQSARQKREDATERLAEAKARLAEREAELAKLPPHVTVERSPAAGPLAEQLEQELAQVERNLTTLRARYTDEKIEVRQAVAIRDALQARLKAELAQRPKVMTTGVNPELEPARKGIRDLRQEVSGYKAQLAALNNTVTSAEREIRKFTGVDGPLGTLAADVANQTLARDNLAARLQAARMALDVAGRESPLVTMDRVDDFNPPVDTTFGRTMKLVLLAALCALIGTAGLVIGYDSVDRRVRTLEEAQVMLPAPVLTAIPQPLGPVTAGILPRTTELEPLSAHSEAYRFLGLHLLSEQGQRIRSLMVLSAKAGQGSTNTVTNLGITLAQAGYRVVIVDANTRTPEIHEVFELENDFGLTDVLASFSEQAVSRALNSTSTPNLQVITSGSPAGNLWELFRSRNLQSLSTHLTDRVDYVLYDTPSAVAFTDAMNLSPVVDAAYLCVRALEPPSGSEKRLIGLLEQSGVPVLGSVLSDIPASVLESYETYQRYYPARPAALTSGTGAVSVESPSGGWIDVKPGGGAAVLMADDDEDDRRVA
ncbi:MAG: GumC family protein [Actinomycetota bacterium]